MDHLYKRGGRERTGTRWDFYEFDEEDVTIGRPVAPSILSRFRLRNARLIMNACERTVILGDNAGVVGFRLEDDMWRGKRLENWKLIDNALAAQDRQLNLSGLGGFDIVETNGQVFLLYNSAAGVFLQVWDNEMSDFEEYWLGDFALDTHNGIKFRVMDSEHIVTISKENPRDNERIMARVVDLTIRKWKLSELAKVRSGEFQDLRATTVESEVVDD